MFEKVIKKKKGSNKQQIYILSKFQTIYKNGNETSRKKKKSTNKIYQMKEQKLIRNHLQF